MAAPLSRVLFPLEAIFIDQPLPANRAFLEKVKIQFGLTVSEEGWQLINPEQLEGIKKLYQETVGELPEPMPGGSGTNVAKALARLGTTSHIIGPIGDDLCGGMFCKAMDRDRLTSEVTTIPGTPTGQVLCIITEGGKRTMLACKGASEQADPNRLNDDHFTSARHVHVEGYAINQRPFLDRVLELSKGAGCTVSYDLGSSKVVEDHRDELMSILKSGAITLLVGNRSEMEALTEQRDSDPRDICTELANICPVVCLTDDERGSYVATIGLKASLYPAHQSGKDTVDATGAGDYYTAAFLHAYLSGSMITTCAQIGNYVASHIVAVQGTELSHQCWEEVLKGMTLFN